MISDKEGSNKTSKKEEEEKLEEKMPKEEDGMCQYLFEIHKLSTEIWMDSLNTVLLDMGFEKTLSLGMPTEDALVHEYSREIGEEEGEEKEKEGEKVVVYQSIAKTPQLTISAKGDLLLKILSTLATHTSVTIAMDVFYNLLGEEMTEKLKKKLQRGLSNLFKKSIDEARKEIEERREEEKEAFKDQIVEDILAKYSVLLEQKDTEINKELLDDLKFLSLEMFGDLLIQDNPQRAMRCYSLCLEIRDDPKVREKFFEAWQLILKEKGMKIPAKNTKK
ncbi:MAG: hypothetical protein ACFE68_02355 [Candidatus Hodarchaeota archaeon]